jgi:hypothetical protein
MYEWPKCVACGRHLYDRRTKKFLYDAMCCSEECESRWEIYFNWRASFRETSETNAHVQIPKFPFFRLPYGSE